MHSAELPSLMRLLSLEPIATEEVPVHHEARERLGLVAAHTASQFSAIHDAGATIFLDLIANTTSMNRETTSLICTFTSSAEIYALRYEEANKALAHIGPLVTLVNSYEIGNTTTIQLLCDKVLEDTRMVATRFYAGTERRQEWEQFEDDTFSELDALPTRQNCAVRYFADRLANQIDLFTQNASSDESRLCGYGTYLAACNALMKRAVAIVDDCDAVATDFLDRVIVRYLPVGPLYLTDVITRVDPASNPQQPSYLAAVPVTEVP